MATRTRSRARAAAAPAEKPKRRQAPVQAAVEDAPQGASNDDEQELEDEPESERTGPSIHLTAEDFDQNPAVIDMGKLVDEDRAAERAALEADQDEDVPAPRGRVRVRLVGVRNPQRPKRPLNAPYGVTLVVPKAGTDAEYDGIHEEGETVQFTRGRPVSVSARAATWLEGHPHYLIEQA